MENHKNKAREFLRYLRSGIDGQDSYYLECLRGEVQKGGLTLKDIGTSEEELKELLAKSYKASAQAFLENRISEQERLQRIQSKLDSEDACY